ncbi:UNVERIFIED_ORG: IS30 family transposase/transposase-like protein [Arthrobacter sp. UYEF10]
MEQSAAAGASVKRRQQSHTPTQKQDFLSAVERLGSVADAAKELGINRSTCQKWANAAGIRPQRRYTQADKDQFYAVLDRTGNIAEAALELGVNISTAHNWAGKVNPATRKPRNTRSMNAGRPQRYSPAVVEEFLTLLRNVGSVSAVAKQLGLNLSTCSNWAKDAGMASTCLRRPSAKQLHYLRLREEGAGRRDAARTVGASKQSSYQWDRQQTAKDTAATEDHAVDLPYKQEVITTFAEPSTPATATEPPASATAPVPTAVALEALERAISARYLSLQERERIADLRSHGTSMQDIGRALGRSVGTISREIRRNSHPVLGYQPYGAHRAATAARARPKDSKLAEPGELHDYVKIKLLTHWSPEQISKLLIKEFPDDEQMRVSPETIYQALYFQARGGLKREVKEALRTGRTRRKKHKNPEERTSRFRDPMINISERPAEVQDRAVPGHWEGDLITGAYNQSAIATLVERTTRYVMLVHLPLDHTAESVRDGLIKTMSTLPAHLRGSLTWDQGAEMAKHKAFSIATDMDVYFCDPASPWQRGSNENTNGLLRQYFPKGTDLNAYGPEDLEHVAQELNGRPRKTLDWDTPAERLRDLLIAS